MIQTLLLLLITIFFGCSEKKNSPVSLLQIHAIHVEQGDSTLIIGPDGTTLLIDGGKPTKGRERIVPYLNRIGLSPSNGLDYIVATHMDSDHIGGLDEVIKAGYNIKKKIWYNGSDKTGTVSIDQFFDTAMTTTAGSVVAISLGEIIPLGNGAKATAVAVGGKVIGSETVHGTDENDKSVALLIAYNGFDYITAGDLGGGEFASDQSCTGRTTSQSNVETPLAEAMKSRGLLFASGVEVLHVNHHGSESSTNHEYMNLLTPKVAIIQTGSGQGETYNHPRKDVVDKVLRGEGNCVTVSPALVLQTGEGDPAGDQTSRAGFVVGDIVIKTSGEGTYEVSGSGSAQPDERSAAGMNPVLTFSFD
jgi:beta-lactamase superfamily II metal-dependent hydrolase